jgi:hypothetical protein
MESTTKLGATLDMDGWETISTKKKSGSLRKGVSWKKHQETIESNIEKVVFREIPKTYHYHSRPGSEITVSWGEC